MEDQYSRNLMWLNELRIMAYQKARKKNMGLILGYVGRMLKYTFMGQFGYTSYAFRRAVNVLKKKEKLAQPSPQTRIIDSNEKIAVYTVLFGKYDILKDPLYVSPNCDYYVLTNLKDIESNVWKKYPLDKFRDATIEFSNLELARFYKLHPDILFPNYKYSIFIDANIQIVTDMVPVVEQLGDNWIAIHNQPGRDCVYQEATEIVVINKAPRDDVYNQIKQYKKEGFPEHYGLFRTCVVVREHGNEQCKKVMRDWWKNIEKYTKRDQLSFSYVLWKNALNKSEVSILSDDVRTNPRFIESVHL